MKHFAECPNCQHEFETTQRAALEGLRCPGCQADFFPASLKEYPDEPLPLPEVERDPEMDIAEAKFYSDKAAAGRGKRLEEAADSASTFALFSAMATGLCALIAIIMLLVDAGPWWIPASLSGWLLLLCIWFVLLKHINMIRAALEKK